MCWRYEESEVDAALDRLRLRREIREMQSENEKLKEEIKELSDKLDAVRRATQGVQGE